MPSPNKNFYVTYSIGSNLARCYSVVIAKDYATAREWIHSVNKGAFAFCYDEEV